MSNIFPSATMTNAMPIVNATVQTIVTLVGAFSQRKSDRAVADAAEAKASQDIRDLRVKQRIAMSSASRTADQATQPNLSILMQLAGQAAVSRERIRSNGQLTAWYYRNLGDQAVYGAGQAGMTFLTKGIAEANNLGFFDPVTPTAVASSGFKLSAGPVVPAGPITPATGTSSPTIVPIGKV